MQAPKKLAELIDKTTNAWGDLAADKSFGGMTLAEFKAKVQPSLEVRGALGTLQSQSLDALTKREGSDAASLQAIQLVVNAIKGDPAHGDDSALYEACGYVRKSARKSGLSRGKGSSTKTAALSKAQEVVTKLAA